MKERLFILNSSKFLVDVSFLVMYMTILLLTYSYYWEDESHIDGRDKQNWINLMSEESYELIILGSSRADAHVNPILLEKLTGMSALNIATGGATYKENYVQLRLYLERNNFPKYALINVDCYSLNSQAAFSAGFHPGYYYRYFGEGRTYLDSLYMSTPYAVWLRKLTIPLVYNNRNSLRNTFFDFTENDDSYRRNGGARLRYDSSFTNNSNKKTFVLDKKDLFWLNKIISFCEINNIGVLLFRSPSYEALDSLHLVKYDLDSLALSENWSYFKDTTSLDTNRFYWNNATHMNATGADAFTYFLTQSLNNRLLNSKGYHP